MDRAELRRRQNLFGISVEELELLLAPMAQDGKEALGSMGDDTPMAVLSAHYRGLHHFFRQQFSQVTNPPIDPLREYRVMSLKTRYGNLGNVYDQAPSQTRILQLESPLLLTHELKALLDHFGRKVASIDCTFDVAAGPGALREALARIRAEAEDAVREGYEQILLSDEASSETRAPMPMILAAGAVHSHLVREGLRSFSSITVRSGECLDVHYVAVLIGVGATALNPYLAEAAIADRHARGLFPGLTLQECLANFKEAIDQGLLKIMSKMGISILSSYRGGYNFEAVGLSRSLCAEYFPGLITRISGIGLAGIQNKVLALHRRAWEDDNPPLAIGGLYRYRRGGERHALEGPQVHQLQYAVASDSYAAYKKYAELIYKHEPIALRDLLDFDRRQAPVPMDEVESITEIRKRFVTPGMSLGALSPEAHETLTIAMNRIGAKSDSGEGGEGKDRYLPRPNGDNANSPIKQVASGRFGVTAEYLNACRELEIKIAQGREARGRRPAAGLQGHRADREIAPRHARRDADLAAAAPRHLLDRGPRPADLRPQADQPGRQGLRQAGLGGRDRHDRGGRRQGQGRRDPGLGPQRRHRGEPADLDQVRRHALGDGAVRGQPGADAQPAAPSRRAAHRRRHQDRPRRGDRGDARRRGIRRRHRGPGRDGLHHGPPVPLQHLPGRGLHPAAGTAREVRGHARQGRQPVQLHRRGGARDPGLARPALAEGGDRPQRSAAPGLARQRRPRRSRPQPAARPDRRRRPSALLRDPGPQRGAGFARRAR